LKDWESLFAKRRFGMRKLSVFVCVCLVAALMTAGTVQAVTIEKYEAEFTSWSGQDAAAVSPVTSSTGDTPASDFFVSFPGNATGTGWLTQGLIGLTPETAKFTYPVAGSSGGGRARFSANLTTSMVGNDGVRVEWRARYGNPDMTRAPIQIGVTETGQTGDEGAGNYEQNAYIRVQNGTNVNILRNGGSLYSDVGTLVLPGLGVGDGQYHEWAAEVVTGRISDLGDSNDSIGRWRLWLDGELLLFPTAGDAHPAMQGAHIHDGVQYSFSTFSDNGFTGAPYIGLGELNTQTNWDFEFDYVRWQNLPEPTAVMLLALGGLVLVRQRRRR
jgi:hypothetical protein